jgi:sialate O-acetylesterase
MKRVLLYIFLLIFFYSEGQAQSLGLPRIFGDHMVLQRNVSCKVWGWAKPNERVTLTIDGENTYTYSDSSGKWTAYLPPHKAGGPFTLKVTADTSVQFDDVMYGEVWIASGQSNMEFRMMDITDGRYDEIIQTANFPDIRYFKVPRGLSSVPKNDLKDGEWFLCSSDSIKRFSAVGWFFIKKIYDELNVPVAIIESSWGATPAEAWTSQDMLETLTGYRNKALKLDSLSEMEWEQKYAEADSLENLKWQIVGSKEGFEKGYASLNYDDSGWETVELPKYNMTDVVWVRKIFDAEIQKKWEREKKEFKLNIGQAYIFQDVYLNEKKLEYKDIRDIHVSAKDLKNGKNILTIRATSPWSNLVHIGLEDGLFLENPEGVKINLKGKWKYNNTLEHPIPKATYFHEEPAFIFNAMINPILGYSMQGVIWYQGESNREYPSDYQELFSTMIQDWRVRWQQGNFPFLFVQLANYLYQKNEPGESNWAEIREAQRKTLILPKTGMAVTIDIGEARNIHPFNKKDVGERLSRAALKMAYGYKNMIESGPLPLRWNIEGDKIKIEFEHVAHGLHTENGLPLKNFAVAGNNQKFCWTEAYIQGNSVVISCPDVPAPKVVRYGWADNPDCNLYNSEMLPASPFQIKF